jgi:hypothetical protein
MKKTEILAQLKEARKIIENCISGLGATSDSPVAFNKATTSTAKPMKIDFGLNERNFVKTYGRGMNGEKKFVLLLAQLTKGKTGSDIETAKVISLWGKMTAKELLGYAYNPKYPTAAKTNGWINSEKYGTYRLCTTWMEILT